jgi:hypothetical protein
MPYRQSSSFAGNVVAGSGVLRFVRLSQLPDMTAIPAGCIASSGLPLLAPSKSVAVAAFSLRLV